MLIRKWLLLLFSFFISPASFGQASDLFISEYIEGSSNEKYIEIYNGTGATVNLTDYQLRLFANGTATPTTTYTLSGTLATGTVIVFRNSAALLYPSATSTGVCNFNGDDAVVLYKISTASYVDIFGNIGCDPGSAWNAGGISTVDQSLVRNSSVCSGITTNPASCTFPTLSTEWTSGSINDVSGLGSHNATCGGCTSAAEPGAASSGILFSSVTCDQMQVSWTNGNGSNSLVVASTSPITGTPTDGFSYTPSSVFGNGSVISPGEHVVYSGSAGTFLLTGLNTNTTYYITVFEFNGTGCPTSGENYLSTNAPAASQITASCICPYITGVIINSCDGTCSEGDNEIIFMNSGDFNIPVDPLNIRVYYGTSPSPTNCYTESFTTNGTYVNTLNNTAACGTLFYDALSEGTIPANKPFLIMSPGACYNYDFSAFCNNYDSVYILFTSDGSWMSSGNFVNSTGCSGGSRYFRSEFPGIAAGCSIDYSYSCASLSGTDGDYVTYSPAGGTPASYIDEDCNFNSSAVLPVSLASFSANLSGNNVECVWITLEETNTLRFELEHSTNGRDFRSFSEVPAAGFSYSPLKYFQTHFNPSHGINYYRLKMVDNDGSFEYSEIAPVRAESPSNLSFYNGSSFVIQSKISGAEIQVFSPAGQLICQKTSTGKITTIPATGLAAGIYFLRIVTGNETVSEKIPVP